MDSSRKRKRRRLRNIVILLLLIICITIGYAILSTGLNITGTSNIKNAIWDVHFENVEVTSNTNVSAIVEPVAKAEDKKTSIQYTVDLYKPGDVYEFTVDVVNRGGVDARLAEKPRVRGVSKEQDVYINYYFTHADGSIIKEDEIITSGESEKVKVRVEFDKTITKEQLPTEIQDLSLNAEMYFEQA